MPLQENFKKVHLESITTVAHVPVIGDFAIKLENVKLEGVSLDQASTGTCHLQSSRAGPSKTRHNTAYPGPANVLCMTRGWLQLPLHHRDFALRERLLSTIQEQSRCIAVRDWQDHRHLQMLRGCALVQGSRWVRTAPLFCWSRA